MRRVINSVLAVTCLSALGACAEPPVIRTPTSVFELRAVPDVQAPLGGDQIPSFRVYEAGAVRDDVGHVQMGAPMGEMYVVVDAQRRLLLLWADNHAIPGSAMPRYEVLGRDVVGSASVRGDRVAWLTQRSFAIPVAAGEAGSVAQASSRMAGISPAQVVPETLDLHVQSSGQTTTYETSLLVLGALRFTSDHSLVGIGAMNGGIAGYQRVGEHPACLTNCDLRAGRSMEGFVPARSEFELVGEALVWRALGQVHSIRWAP